MDNQSDIAQFSDLLMSSTEAMFESGQPLMNRIVPTETPAEIWTHYPNSDVINGPAGSRYFYHCHPPGERIDGEHGHFHLFLDKSAMPGGVAPLISPPPENLAKTRADVVHIAALAISVSGLPLAWFGINRWVTDEWVYPAETIIGLLERFDMRGPMGDPLVNDWLTGIVGLARQDLTEILHERDRVLKASDPSGEDRQVEVTSTIPISLEKLFAIA
ncbi:MAG: hypothetical protein ABJP48_09210 [Erythrobacter sp.]